ncbi:DUF2500 domain-containing protein [Chengkuizengella axinellae]|uniref:DUF2500 domain-containing protein n=1 Tax=Chengkuizengella axinellae TaxID=3064388 RepID=A0ABT9IV39_9BACL|nr:DUF2500 domain-containing protein [Chengkuizengella sp. 2205SS18-9]MDP5273187.1 DUF2500 domain-containing protein [Chengkuizengella sp. 2205SS18-9]
MGFPSTGPSIMFTIVPIFISIVFIIVIGGIIFTLFKGITQWNYNNKQPVLSVNAKVVAKRDQIRRRRQNDRHSSYNSTTYYTTFEVESGDRMELEMTGEQFGLLVEGDLGKLTFQGSRYKGFERTI